MFDMSPNLLDACWDCLTFDESGLSLAYAAIVLFFGYSYDKKLLVRRTHYGNPELGSFSMPSASIQTEIVRFIASFLTPQRYVISIRGMTQRISKITKINSRGFMGNVFVLFLFYYFIVSAPAAMMVPVNYNNISYNGQSFLALFLMMLTNAIGDVISFKITLRNIKRIISYYRSVIKSNKEGFNSLSKSMLLEFRLYLITIIDMVLAALILVCVLVVTAVLFGISVGEFRFEISSSALYGAMSRVESFWVTALEPYWFRQDVINSVGDGLPMLLIYSLTSFIPSILILFIALFWTLTLPLRVIYYSNRSKTLKIVLSEGIVIAMCSIAMSVYKSVSS